MVMKCCIFSSTEGRVLSLTEIASREVAASIPFELVEHYFPPVPEELQLRIAFWSFPEQVTSFAFDALKHHIQITSLKL